jgi:hypothetical protein
LFDEHCNEYEEDKALKKHVVLFMLPDNETLVNLGKYDELG